MNDEWLDAMAAFYRAVDEDMDRLTRLGDVLCEQCGNCCHFDEAGHVLYASELEKRYLLHVDGLPECPDGGRERVDSGDRCPYQGGDACHARSGRVLGCRLHFCQWPDVAAAEAAAEQWHARLKRLHDDLGVEWRYARLLPLNQ
jgi:hypothetical protein